MEKTKQALSVLLKVSSKVVNAMEDGKITWSEAAGISWAALGIVGIVKDLPEIGEEIKSLTPGNINELVSEFANEFDLPNDELEKKIEAGIQALANLIVLFL